MVLAEGVLLRLSLGSSSVIHVPCIQEKPDGGLGAKFASEEVIVLLRCFSIRELPVESSQLQGAMYTGLHIDGQCNPESSLTGMVPGGRRILRPTAWSGKEVDDWYGLRDELDRVGLSF